MRGCPVCDLLGTKPFFQLEEIPVSIGTLWVDYASARSCPVGALHLVYCPRCELIYNSAFEESRLEYDQKYNNSLHFSPVYQQYAEQTVKKLIEKYGLRNKEIIEIGCGKGDFLILLCQHGDNTGVGFDNSYEERHLENGLSSKVSFINDLYHPGHANFQGDLICSRYVLEHINKPVEFLKTLRGMINEKRDPVVYFEVPNASLILEKFSIWDLIYEHCIYFSHQSLKNSFEISGFDVLDVYDGFDSQFLCIESKPGSVKKNTALLALPKDGRLSSAVKQFTGNFMTVMNEWKSSLQEIKNDKRSAVLWGAGAKGVSFLNLCNVVDEIRYVVDINPEKQGKFISGTGQEIISPEQLHDYNPDLVIILNPIYKEEISTMLSNRGMSPELLCFH